MKTNDMGNTTSPFVLAVLYLIVGTRVVYMLPMSDVDETVDEICSGHGKSITSVYNDNQDENRCVCDLHLGYSMHFAGTACEIHPWEKCMHETDVLICQSRMDEQDGSNKQGICVDLLCSGRGECAAPLSGENNSHTSCVCRIGMIGNMPETITDVYIQYDPNVFCKLSTVSSPSSCNTTHGVVLRDYNLQPTQCYCYVTSQSPRMGMACSLPVPAKCLGSLSNNSMPSDSLSVCSRTGLCVKSEYKNEYMCDYTRPPVVPVEKQCDGAPRMLVYNSMEEESFFCESLRYKLCGDGGTAIIHGFNEYTCKCPLTRRGVRCENPSCLSLLVGTTWVTHPGFGRCMSAYYQDHSHEELLYAKYATDDHEVTWFKLVPFETKSEWVYRQVCVGDGVLGIVLAERLSETGTGIVCVYESTEPTGILYASNETSFTVFTETKRWSMSLKWSHDNEQFEITERCMKNKFSSVDTDKNICVCISGYSGSFCEIENKGTTDSLDTPQFSPTTQNSTLSPTKQEPSFLTSKEHENYKGPSRAPFDLVPYIPVVNIVNDSYNNGTDNINYIIMIVLFCCCLVAVSGAGGYTLNRLCSGKPAYTEMITATITGRAYSSNVCNSGHVDASTIPISTLPPPPYPAVTGVLQ
jgi:hypothetical protein